MRRGSTHTPHLARTREAEVTLATDIDGRADAFNPAELFPAAIALCMIKGIERVAPTLNFELLGVEVVPCRSAGRAVEDHFRGFRIDLQYARDGAALGFALHQHPQVRHDFEHRGGSGPVGWDHPKEDVSVVGAPVRAPIGIPLRRE